MRLNTWPGAIFSGLISDVLGAVVVLLLGLAGYAMVRFVARKDLEAFFGIDSRRAGSVQIKLSNIVVKECGTEGVTAITKGFSGTAITEGEYAAAVQLSNAIEDGTLIGFAKLVGRYLSQGKLKSPGVCRISVSPKRVGDALVELVVSSPATAAYPANDRNQAESVKALNVTSDVAVLIGSPVYNSLTDYVARSLPDRSHFRFVRVQRDNETTRAITFLEDDQAPREYPRHVVAAAGTEGQADDASAERTDKKRVREYFVVEKIAPDKKDGLPSTIFVCAGTGTAATANAVRVLQNWKQLKAQFGNRPFTVLYWLETDDTEWEITDWSLRRQDTRSPGPIEQWPRSDASD